MELFLKFYDEIGKDMMSYGTQVNYKEILEIDVTAKEMIQTTLDQQVPESPNSEKYVDNAIDLIRVMLDFSNCIMGSDNVTYNDYCQRIRMESQHVPDKQYIQERIALLKRICNIPEDQDVINFKDAP